MFFLLTLTSLFLYSWRFSLWRFCGHFPQRLLGTVTSCTMFFMLEIIRPFSFLWLSMGLARGGCSWPISCFSGENQAVFVLYYFSSHIFSFVLKLYYRLVWALIWHWNLSRLRFRISWFLHHVGSMWGHTLYLLIFLFQSQFGKSCLETSLWSKCIMA